MSKLEKEPTAEEFIESLIIPKTKNKKSALDILMELRYPEELRDE